VCFLKKHARFVLVLSLLTSLHERCDAFRNPSSARPWTSAQISGFATACRLAASESRHTHRRGLDSANDEASCTESRRPIALRAVSMLHPTSMRISPSPVRHEHSRSSSCVGGLCSFPKGFLWTKSHCK